MARVHGDPSLPPLKLLHDVEITRMGEGLGQTGRIGEAAQERTLQAVRRLLERARACHPDGISALGMEAFRRAENGAAFAARIGAETGVTVRILRGEEEAGLGREGVLRALGPSRDGRPWLLVDIGGGSTELALTDPLWEISVPLGAVLVTERYLAGDPPTTAEMRTMRDALDERLAAAWAQAPQASPHLVGVGGTITTYACVAQGLERYETERVHGYVLDAAAIAAVTQRLAALPLAQRSQVPGLHPQRAPVILGGGGLLEAALRAVGEERIVVSEANLLHAWVVREAHGLGRIQAATSENQTT